MSSQERSSDKRVDEERGVYVISVAAELAGVHPQTLRMYERKGLLSPKRTRGNSRRYSRTDVEWVRRIQRLTQSEGINLAGVRMIIELQRRLQRMEAQLQRARKLADEAAERQKSSEPTWGAIVRLRDVQNIFEESNGP